MSETLKRNTDKTMTKNASTNRPTTTVVVTINYARETARSFLCKFTVAIFVFCILIGESIQVFLSISPEALPTQYSHRYTHYCTASLFEFFETLFRNVKPILGQFE